MGRRWDSAMSLMRQRSQIVGFSRTISKLLEAMQASWTKPRNMWHRTLTYEETSKGARERTAHPSQGQRP